MEIRRVPGEGWLVLIGGGEFSFGETVEADAAWIAKAPPGGIGFIPAASGSVDYGHHFGDYAAAELGREAETIPVYRDRDGRRRRNAERITTAAAVYLGGGVTDHLLEALGAGAAGESTPVAAALLGKLREGGVVVAIAAAAQAVGVAARSIAPGAFLAGLGWLPGGVVEPNFDPGHDRRLRQLLGRPGVEWGLGIPAGAAVLLGPGGAVEVVGTVFGLDGPEGELVTLGETSIQPN